MTVCLKLYFYLLLFLSKLFPSFQINKSDQFHHSKILELTEFLRLESHLDNLLKLNLK